MVWSRRSQQDDGHVGGAKGGGLWSTVRSLMILFGFAVLLAFVLKIFVVDVYRVASSSMENTVLSGDFLLINKIAYGALTPPRIPFTSIEIPSLKVPGLTTPEWVDVVVFRYPGDQYEVRPSLEVNFVKRCIALPGDTVSVIDRRVSVNGHLLPQPPEARFEGRFRSCSRSLRADRRTAPPFPPRS